MPARGKRGRFRKDPLARERSLEVLWLMRKKGLSLTAAARKAGTTVSTVLEYVPKALRRTESGRYEVTPSDRYTRYPQFLTPDGPVEVAVRGSRPAERVGRYMEAVRRYVYTGDTAGLAEFHGQKIRSRNQTYFFLTDTRALDRLGHAGEISFERLYNRRA
jgi:hypothetical protein